MKKSNNTKETMKTKEEIENTNSTKKLLDEMSAEIESMGPLSTEELYRMAKKKQIFAIRNHRKNLYMAAQEVMNNG